MGKNLPPKSLNGVNPFSWRMCHKNLLFIQGHDNAWTGKKVLSESMHA